MSAADALRDMLTRLEVVASSLTAPSRDGSPLGNEAYGVRHLTRQIVMALQSEVEFGDPRSPILHRYEQPWVQWGGPNPDNVYRRCAIDPNLSYRLWGNIHGAEQLIVSQVDGDMHLGQFGVFHERTLGELGVGPDGSFECLLRTGGPSAQGPQWPIDPSARLLLIREYYNDWEAAPAVINVECLEWRGIAPPMPTDDGLAAALLRVTGWVEESMSFWEQYAEGARNKMVPNTFGPPASPPGGATNIAYGAGWWVLDAAKDETLLIECDAADADYCGWTLHSRFWLDSGDFAVRQTSLNAHQLHVDHDGVVRIVASATDPGCPNWLDIANEGEGMLVYRYVGARTKPVPSARVVTRSDLRSLLPAQHPTVSTPERAEQLARRRAAVHRR